MMLSSAMLQCLLLVIQVLRSVKRVRSKTARVARNLVRLDSPAEAR